MVENKPLYLGVDPGKSGAFALVDVNGKHYDTIKLSETPIDVVSWLEKVCGLVDFAVIENVHAMPKQGVSSTFTFGKSFGFCIGLLCSMRIPHEFHTPVKWQTAMSCRTKGDKNVSKRRAQQLWPTIKITHAIADALLIADYARRIRNPQSS